MECDVFLVANAEFEECDGCGLVSTESNLEEGGNSSLTEIGQKMR